MRADDLPAIEAVVSELAARHCIRRQLDLSSGAWTTEAPSTYQPLSLSDQQMQHSLGPQHRLVLVGAGPLAESIAQFAPALAYRVVVCDPRPDQLAQWRFSNAECVQGMPDDVIRELGMDADTSVLALSHDPRIDDMALLEALESPAAYIGALGSARTAARRRERLGELGLDRQAIDRLHAPVGLNIGAKTPAEIAVAILAELTQLRRS